MTPNRRSVLAGIGTALSMTAAGCLISEDRSADSESNREGECPDTQEGECPETQMEDLIEGDYPPVALESAPEPYEESSTSGDSTSDQYITHPLEYNSVEDRIRTYNDTRDPTILYHRELANYLEDNPEKDQLRVTVTTLGKRTHTQSAEGRDIYGFTPTENEVECLDTFGEITYVPDFISTDVTMICVARESLPRIAALPFVIEVAHSPSETPA